MASFLDLLGLFISIIEADRHRTRASNKVIVYSCIVTKTLDLYKAVRNHQIKLQRMIWKSRLKLLIIAVVISLFFLYNNVARITISQEETLVETITDVYDKIFMIYYNGNVNVTSDHEPVEYLDRSQLKGSNTKLNLLARARVDPEIQKQLTEKHQYIMGQMPLLTKLLRYNPGTSGVVLVGGGRFSWLSYLAIKSVRKTGCTLPIELIMPSYEDYENEKDFCDNWLPKDNARCIVLPEVLGPRAALNWEDKLGGYMLKSLAMLVSSFQNIVLLDSDNIAVQDPAEVFESKLFKENGMITWPDYWARAVSPIYYDIVDIHVDEHTRPRFNRFPLVFREGDDSYSVEDDDDIPFHDLEGAIADISTESGQLMLDKSTHACTLLLSVYYNLLGPGLYYRLFSLGDLGEGDKDTFPAAALVCNEKIYQVSSYISTFGYFEGHEFRGVGMGQKNPLVDYDSVQEFVVKPIEDKQLNVQQQMDFIDQVKSEYFDKPSSSLFTIHCNYPKLDPMILMDKESLYDPVEERLMYKMYSDYTYKHAVIKDKSINLELDIWKTINQVLCEERVNITYFADKDMTKVCNLAANQVSWLS